MQSDAGIATARSHVPTLFGSGTKVVQNIQTGKAANGFTGAGKLSNETTTPASIAVYTTKKSWMLTI